MKQIDKKTIGKFTLFLTIIFTFLFNSCTVMQVSNRKSNGYFSSYHDATTIQSKEVNLDSLNSLLLIPDIPFVRGMLYNIGYFGEIITREELELMIIKDGKQDEIESISGRLGLSNACRKYEQFLLLAFDRNENNDYLLQIQLIDPSTYEAIFVAEIVMDPAVAGVNDQNTYNPLFNELIKYIEKNSKTYNIYRSIPPDARK